MLYGELPEVAVAGSDKKVSGYPVEILNPPKTALLRLPTSAEILERMKKETTITQDIGRGKTKSDSPPTPEADKKLFDALRLDKGEEFDEFEMVRALNKVIYNRVSERERQGAEFEIKLECYGGVVTTHTLTPPTEKQMHDYRKSVVITKQLDRTKQELRFKHEVAVRLYDENIQSADGYLDNKSVPAHHKFTIALELASLIDDLDPVLDPNS